MPQPLDFRGAVRQAVRLSAPVTMLAAIGGFTVAGIVGALVAVPTIGALKAVVVHVREGGSTELRGTATTEDVPTHGLHRLVARVRARFGHTGGRTAGRVSRRA